MSHGSHSLLSPRVVGLVACMVGEVAVAPHARAQFTSAIDLSSRSSQPTSNEWQNRLAISPFARFDHPRVAVDARWTTLSGIGSSDTRRVDGFGNIGATYFSPARAGLQLSVDAFADRTLLNETFAVSRFGGDARLSYRAGRSGAWIEREISRDNKSTPALPVPHYVAGAWRQWGRAIVTLAFSSSGSLEGASRPTSHTEVRPSIPLTLADSERNFRGFDTVTVVDSGSAGRRHDWRDAELGFHWSSGRLAFQGSVGTRFSATRQPNERWARMQSAVTLAPDIALLASTGTHPSSAAYGVPRSRYLELGFRVSPSALRRLRLPSGVRPTAADFQIDEAARGGRTLRIRIPSARSVELSGDFTNWKPIALTRGDTDEWETTLVIAPGLHRLAIRIDGDKWMTPPGVAAVNDEFQGTVGVIVIK